MASGRASTKRAMLSLAHLEVPELNEALSMGEGLDFIGLVEAKFLGKSHSGSMSTLTTFNYAGIFGKHGEFSVGFFYVYIDAEGVLKGNFDEDQPDDIYDDLGAARAALRNTRMASAKQALDAVNEQFNAPTQDPRADKDYVNPFQGKIRSEGKDIDPAIYRDLLDAAKDTVAPGANTASDKTATVNSEGVPYTDEKMAPYRAQWEAFLQKLVPRYRVWGEPQIDTAEGTMTVNMKDHPGYALKVCAEWFGYYDRNYKYDFPTDDDPGMASNIYTLLETAAGQTVDTLAQWEVHHRRGRLMYLPTPRAFAKDVAIRLQDQKFDEGQQPLPFNASAMKARYMAYGRKKALDNDDGGIEIHTDPKKLPPSQFRKHIDKDLKEEIAESKKDASSRSMYRG